MAEQTPVPKEWLTMKEAAIYMGVSLATVRRWLRLGLINRYLPPGGAGNFVRVKKSELDQFMRVEPYKRWKPHRMADRLKSESSSEVGEIND